MEILSSPPFATSLVTSRSPPSFSSPPHRPYTTPQIEEMISVSDFPVRLWPIKGLHAPSPAPLVLPVVSRFVLHFLEADMNMPPPLSIALRLALEEWARTFLLLTLFLMYLIQTLYLFPYTHNTHTHTQLSGATAINRLLGAIENYWGVV